MNNCVIYCYPISEHRSCEVQESQLRQLADRLGYSVVGAYADVASTAKLNRPARADILALVRRKSISAVLVVDLLAICHDLPDTEWLFSQFLDSGVALVALCDRGSLSLSHAPMSVWLEALAFYQRLNAEVHARQIKGAMAQAKAKGAKFGREVGTKLYAKKEGKVKTLLAQGMSIRKVAEQCGLSTNTVLKIKKSITAKEQLSIPIELT